MTKYKTNFEILIIVQRISYFSDLNSFVTVTSVTRSFHERMKYDHHLLVEEPRPTTLQPQSTSVSVTSEAAIVLNEEDKGIPGLIDRGHGSSLQQHREQVEQPEGIRSETARALNELGFTYNEYIDDSDLLGDDSNDEVCMNTTYRVFKME